MMFFKNLITEHVCDNKFRVLVKIKE